MPSASRVVLFCCVVILSTLTPRLPAQEPDPTPPTAVPSGADAQDNSIVVEAPKPEDPMRDVTEIDRVTVTGTNGGESLVMLVPVTVTRSVSAMSLAGAAL